MKGVVSRALPRLSPVLQAAVLQAVAMSDAIYAIHPATTGPSSRENLGAVYCSIALDHREAIILLVRHGAFSSASALARAVYEACIRGLWARFAATEEQVERVIGKGILPKFETVAKELAAHEEMGLLARVRNEVWGPLSEYAHSGKRQIDFWYSEGQIGSQHDEVALADMLLLMDVYGYFALTGMLACAGLDIAPDEGIAEALLIPRIRSLEARTTAQNGSE